MVKGAIWVFDHFHRQVCGGQTIAIVRDEGGESILFEEGNHLGVVFFTIIFWDMHLLSYV
jgi:hypothetical protein